MCKAEYEFHWVDGKKKMVLEEKEEKFVLSFVKFGKRKARFRFDNVILVWKRDPHHILFAFDFDTANPSYTHFFC